jgi:hypothetical protein
MDYKEQFRELLLQVKQDRQCGTIPMFISEVLAEQFDDDMLRWCEFHIARKRAEIASREIEYKQNLCESKNL